MIRLSSRFVRTFHVASLACIASGAAAAPQPLDVMPAPARAEALEGRLPVTAPFHVAVSGSADARLRDAVGRMLAAWERRTNGPLRGAIGADPAQASLVIDCRVAGPPIPSLHEDESYALEVSARKAVLRSETAVGALRGLATVQQLLRRDASGWFLPAASIRDEPRFPWRGLHIDVARRWEPAEVIRRNLDGMALVKLNVLHLHLSDDQGFRIECRTHPELTAQGSDGRFFTQEEMRGLIAYAADRGIRVVPEFDLPGHATSWVVSHPELASGPGPYQIERHWGVFDPTVDPTNEALYRLLGDVFGEMAALFPDAYLHIGGDENNGVQWNANPRIQAFIRDQGLGDNAGLQARFNQRIGAILSGLGRRAVGWDEILHPDLPRDDVIESWRGADSLAKAAGMGYDGILANGYYVDLCNSAAEHYGADPLPASSTLSAEARRHILGGEAMMWGEWVTPETIDSRIWPRTAAIAERLWSPPEVRDVADMYRRLEAVDARLDEAGLQQRSYRGPMLERLLGGARSPAAMAALGEFIGAIEPVKGYSRGKQQPGFDQWAPLIGVTDAASPESDAARIFADAAQGWLSHPKAGPDGDARVRATLIAWRDAGRSVGGELAARQPGLAPAAPLAMQLADAASVGLEAAEAVDHGRLQSPEWRTASLARLESDSEPHDGSELAVIAPIRQLVLAATAH